ncbi:MAG: PPC domain-containing protein [Chloroflexota bacterium]
MRWRLLLVVALLTIFGVVLVAQQETDVVPAGTYLGEITDANPSDRYRFEAIAGQQVTLLMEATEDSLLDSALSLFDTNGILIQTDDDSGGNRNARIEFIPQVNGIFTVEATRYQLNPPLTVGAYQLTIMAESTTQGSIDPLSLPPDFDVAFVELALDDTTPASFTTGDDLQYFVIGAQQGDFIRAELTTNENLSASVRILSRIEGTLNEISRASQTGETNEVIFATIPQTGWYLIEVEREEGIGGYTITPAIVSDTLLAVENPITDGFDNASETLSYVFNATINERVFVNLTVADSRNLEPEITIFDLNGTQLAQSSSAGSQVRANLEIPRSSPYIVQVRNLNNRIGDFTLQLRRIAVDIDKLPIEPATYNERYLGFLDDDTPIDYYRFSGKAGELVTIQMSATTNSTLDSYLILADSNLNELIFNDNVSASRTARIVQFTIPADGDYFILATRAELSRGNSEGFYVMDLTVGRLQLQTGQLTATLEWEGEADLNLFMLTPSLANQPARTVSWANPQIEEGGTLQIDSNTGCETPTAQPIEHVFWDEASPLASGDYIFWVWYQNDCMMSGDTPFTLTVTYNGETIISTSGALGNNTLRLGERFESSIRITDTDTAFLLDEGTIRTPSAQQTESQGGDALIVYGDTLSGSITNEVFAQFYQFVGNAGDTVVIIVERVTNNLDPIVILRDEDDLDSDGIINIATNDDISPDNRNSQLIYTLTETGRYVIAVTRYGVRDGTTTGDYQLTLSQIATPDLTEE